MKKRWANGFTIVEILIVVIVIAILATVVTVGYSSLKKASMEKAVQSDLQQASASMASAIQKTNAYPSTLPNEIKSSDGVTLTLVESSVNPYYANLSDVQEGVLFAQICADLIADGVGNGLNQAGVTQDYITGCGNWNHDSMQITGWDTMVWNVPVDEAPLINYADNFTTNDSWNKAGHEGAVKNFYHGLVDRFTQQGGTFPITSFWDSWATPQNGGVINEPLPSNPVIRPYFCIEAKPDNFSDVIWHITQDDKLEKGQC